MKRAAVDFEAHRGSMPNRMIRDGLIESEAVHGIDILEIRS